MNYTKALKQAVKEDYEKGEKVKDICDKHKIPKSTIYYWLKESLLIDNGKTITYADYEKLKNKLHKKELELEIYENLHCFKDSSNKEKEIAISKFIGKYPVKVMCRLLNIPTGTVYNYLFRRTIITQNNIRDEDLKNEIYRLFKESDERFGAKKIWIKLRETGFNTSLNKVQNLMKLLNIKSKQTIRKNEEKRNDNSQYYVKQTKKSF